MRGPALEHSADGGRTWRPTPFDWSCQATLDAIRHNPDAWVRFLATVLTGRAAIDRADRSRFRTAR